LGLSGNLIFFDSFKAFSFFSEKSDLYQEKISQFSFTSILFSCVVSSVFS
jgi:hypothetical protein